MAPERLAELEIDRSPLRGLLDKSIWLAKSDGARIALKIQYPGVDGAIDGDLKRCVAPGRVQDRPFAGRPTTKV